MEPKKRSFIHSPIIAGDFYERFFTFITIALLPLGIAYVLDIFVNFTGSRTFFEGIDFASILGLLIISAILNIWIYNENITALKYSFIAGLITAILFIVYVTTSGPVESPVFLAIFLFPFYLIPIIIFGLLTRFLMSMGKVLGLIFSCVILSLILVFFSSFPY